MIPFNGIFPIGGAIKVHPNDTTIAGYNYYRFKYLVTRAELQTLISSNLVNPNAIYCIKDAVSSTLVVAVFADTNSTIHSGAYQFTNIPNSAGTYDIVADTWTDCCGGGGSGTVTSVATAGLISGGPITTSGTITTSMNTNKLVGRGTAGTGIMEEITLGTGLSLSGTTLNVGSVSGSILHTTASGTDTYTATVTGVTSYSDGDAYLVRFTNGNTTGCTLNINSIGAVTLYRNNDGALIGGDIWSGSEMLCIYNSTLSGFQCIGTSPNSLFSYVTNSDSVTLNKGDVVYAFGGTGDRMTVKRALNTSDATSAQTVGLVLSTSIAANQKGIIIMQGLLDGLSILPTSTYADGDPIYLGSTAGAITNVKPYAPNHLVYLGVVTTASAGSAGRMYVKVQNGYELDELHNVQAQSPTLKDTLWYDNTVSPAQWKTASISTILGYTPLSNVLTSANIFVGNGSNVATGVAMSGDATITNAGAVTVGKINGATLGTTTATDKNILIANGTSWVTQAMSGDVTIGNTGVTAIGNSKVTNAMLAGSIDLTSKVTGALPIANGGTNATTELNARTNLSLRTYIDSYASLGSGVLAESYPAFHITAASAGLTSGQIGWYYIGTNVSGTLTGVIFYLQTNGSYTASNNNKIGLYSYSGGTLTLVASSANNGNLFKAGGNTYVKEPFTSTYAATAGTPYFVAEIYSSSAVTTAPALGVVFNAVNLAVVSLDFTNSVGVAMTLTGQTDLPASQAASGLTKASAQRWHGVY